MKDLNKQLKFDIGCELKVTLKEWKPEETNYGTKNVYYIEEIDGKDWFEAAPGLHNKINDAGIVNGETFVIKKMQLEEKQNRKFLKQM